MAVKGMKLFISLFVIAILAIVLLQTIGDRVTGGTTTQLHNDSTVGTTITPDVYVDLEGKAVTGLYAINQSGTTVPATNYTTRDDVVGTSGTISAQINVTNASATHHGSLWNISYTFSPVGYVSNSAGRNMFTLVLIMGAVALLVTVLVVLLRSEGAKRILSVGR